MFRCVECQWFFVSNNEWQWKIFHHQRWLNAISNFPIWFIWLAIKVSSVIRPTHWNESEWGIEEESQRPRKNNRHRHTHTEPRDSDAKATKANATFDFTIVQRVKEKTFQFNPIMQRCRTFHWVNKNETIAGATCRKKNTASYTFHTSIFFSLSVVFLHLCLAFNKWKNIGFEMDSSNQHRFESIP